MKQTSEPYAGRSMFKSRMQIVVLIAALFGFAIGAGAQGIRFQFNQLRATVPVGTTTNTFFGANPNTNNTVFLVNGCTNANFDIAGLPAGVGATLIDASGNALPSTTISTNLIVRLDTTNVVEGVYTFYLNAGGFDTNGAPVTNKFPFVLQSAHIWRGGFNGASQLSVSNNWATATNWYGGVPTASSDVVFSDAGAQTNIFANGIWFTNVGIDTSVTVASIRFAQSSYTNASVTNSSYHGISLAPNTLLSVTGTNGFSLLRDYIGEFNYSPDSTMGVHIRGTNSSMMVSNAAANFAINVGSGQQPTLIISNLGSLVTYVSRVGFSDYQLYPNYRALNDGFNGGRDTTNYGGLPRRFWNNVYLAKTNYITATYKDPQNYTNEFTRGYAMMLQNNEQSGNGSSVNTFLLLGVTNVFRMDSVCLVGANSASGNGGGVRFYRGGSTAIFRSTNDARMSIFTVSDGGGTNQASSNIKANIDFSGNTNYLDILADRFYIARDRTMIASNQTPNVSGSFTMGYGNVDVNTAILGYQEHNGKIDWTTIGGAQAYLNYCQGTLIVSNGSPTSSQWGGTFRVNKTLTLGYTADTNPIGSAQQYNTFGRITIYSNATVIASNIVCDGGLNYYDSGTGGRQNAITINQGGTLLVSNTVGSPNPGADYNSGFAAAGDPQGIMLDNLTIAGGKLAIFVNPSRTNVCVRNLLTPGINAGVIKVQSLTGVSSYPAQIPVIAYQGTASPFLTADVSALGGGYNGYVLNNVANSTVDLYITTNAPNNLIWTGNQNNSWDSTSINWVTAVGGIPTNFNLGDAVTFNDSSAVTNVSISGTVVPGQTGVGVTISNNIYKYVFSGGTIGGTALVAKQGTNSLEFNASELGPINIMAGNIYGNGGALGNATLWTNTTLKMTNGTITGGLTSTGIVQIVNSTLTGPVSIQGNYLDNAGVINTTFNQLITMATGTALTNEPGATITVGTGTGAQNSQAWIVPLGSTLMNLGTIFLVQPRIEVQGVYMGNGLINYPNGGGLASISDGNAPRLLISQGGVMGIGTNLFGSVSTVDLQCRFDFNNDPTATPAGISTIWMDFDFANPQINDIIRCDRWNNDTGLLLFTNINPSAGTFTNGQVFTILQNTSGSGTNNNVDTTGFSPFIKPYLPGPGLVWGTTNFNTYGTISVTTNALVWDGVSTTTWGTNLTGDASWKLSQAFQNNMGAFFGDNANGSGVVNLITNVAPAGERGVSLHSNQPAIYPGIVVSNATKNYVFAGAGKITGITGIYKTGSGTLTLLTTNANDFSGNVIIEQGTLAVSNFGANINILSLGSAGGGQMKNDLIFDGGTLSFIGTTNCNLNHFPFIYPSGGTIDVPVSSSILSLDRAVSGSGVLTKTGAGVLNLPSTSDVYTGGTVVNGGTLKLTGAGAGFGAITLNNNTAIEVTNNVSFTNQLNVNGSGLSFRVLGTSTNTHGGIWTGSGSITFSNVNPFVFNASLSAFSGSVSFGSTSGNYQFNAATNNNPCTGSALATFDLGTGSSTLSNYNGGGLTYDLGALSGGANTILAGRMTNSADLAGTTYRIGAKGSSTTFSGKIQNGQDTVTVVKVGSGSLLLNGVSTYTGSTTVSNGVLGGNGSIASALTVKPGATLAPGTSIGTFTVNNSATLGGVTLMELNQANAGQTNDLLVVTGALVGTGGTLIVTNVGPTITNGATFKLFSQAVTGFSSITLPNGGYVWTTNLAVNGSITLVSGGVSTVNPGSTNILTSVSGNTLTLTWPADHTGWRLQVQTNTLGVGLYTNWTDVAGSTTTNSVNFLMNPNNGSVFYRIVYP